MHKQNEKFNKDIETVKKKKNQKTQKNPPEILELKVTVTELENSVQSFNNQLDYAKERINKPEKKII